MVLHLHLHCSCVVEDFGFTLGMHWARTWSYNMYVGALYLHQLQHSCIALIIFDIFACWRRGSTWFIVIPCAVYGAVCYLCTMSQSVSLKQLMSSFTLSALHMLPQKQQQQWLCADSAGFRLFHQIVRQGTFLDGLCFCNLILKHLVWKRHLSKLMYVKKRSNSLINWPVLFFCVI